MNKIAEEIFAELEDAIWDCQTKIPVLFEKSKFYRKYLKIKRKYLDEGRPKKYE